jgi:hypothetical protein
VGLVASTFHFPVAPRGIPLQTTDPSRYVDVDAASLRVAFDAPPSGRVMVSIQAPGGSGFSTSVGYWALRGTGGEGPDDVVPGSERFIYGPAGLKQWQDGYQVILDVQPGRRYEWTFAFKPGDRRGTIVKIGHPEDDPTGHGPVLIEVWDTGTRGRR